MHSVARTLLPLLMALGVAACRRGPATPAGAPQACGPGAPCAADFFCAPSKRCVSKVVAVAAGLEHTCALHHDGHLSCWGLSDLVKATAGGPVSGPVPIAGFEAVSTLAVGAQQTCAVKKDGGTVHCFGSQDFSVRDEAGKPVADVTAVALGTGFGCASNDSGTHCWGRNEYGQLARSTGMTGSSVAVLSKAGKVAALGTGLAAITLSTGAHPTICGWGNNSSHLVLSDDKKGAVTEPVCRDAVGAVGLTVGTGHACVRLDMGGFTCWGERYYGQLGIASTDKADVPPPGVLTGLPGKCIDIVAGAGHTCALADNGRVFCFGLNNAGQVSEAPAPAHILSPYERPGLAGRVAALGSGPSAQHTCAVLKDGGVECWGRNHRGQLGDAPTKAIDDRFSHAAVRVAF